MLNKLKLTTKLLGSFLVVLLIMIIVGIMGYRAMSGVAERKDGRTRWSQPKALKSTFN